MKKFLAVFLIAVVAMTTVFADDHVSLTDTVQISATRPAYTDIAFYSSSDFSGAKADDISWEEAEGGKSTVYYLYMVSNDPREFDVSIYATGMTRDGAQNDVVPLTITIDKVDYVFDKARGAEDYDGTEKTDVNNNPIKISFGAGNGMRSITKAIGFSADFTNASAGNYYGYATVVAAAK